MRQAARTLSQPFLVSCKRARFPTDAHTDLPYLPTVATVCIHAHLDQFVSRVTRSASPQQATSPLQFASKARTTALDFPSELHHSITARRLPVRVFVTLGENRRVQRARQYSRVECRLEASYIGHVWTIPEANVAQHCCSMEYCSILLKLTLGGVYVVPPAHTLFRIERRGIRRRFIAACSIEGVG